MDRACCSSVTVIAVSAGLVSDAVVMTPPSASLWRRAGRHRGGIDAFGDGGVAGAALTARFSKLPPLALLLRAATLLAS
jgi:hypothetical protein